MPAVIKIHRKPWVLQRGNAGEGLYGYASNDPEVGRIVIDSSLEGRKKLEIVLHEVLHAGHWGLPEAVVSKIATAQARAAYLAGYREVPELAKF